jgi:hypothetical protein
MKYPLFVSDVPVDAMIFVPLVVVLYKMLHDCMIVRTWCASFFLSVLLFLLTERYTHTQINSGFEVVPSASIFQVATVEP